MKKMICVVGAGHWGKNHIKTLNKLGALSGVVDVDKNILKKVKFDFPDIRIHQSIENALKYNYDGFIVATPAKSHFNIAKTIINNKKHVLIEKPMTLSIKDAKKLVALSEAQNVNVIVGHVLLFHPAVMKIKEMIEKGEIGDLQYIYSNRLNLGKVRTHENVFWSLAPHDIAIFQHLTNSIPKIVYANGSTFLQEGIPDSTLTQLEYENGIKGHIFVSWLHPFKEHRLVVVGSEAMISFEDSLKDKPLKLYSKKIDFNFGIPEKIDGPEEVVPFQKKMPLEIELEYFIDHLSKKKPDISNIYHGLDVVKTLVKASEQLLK